MAKTRIRRLAPAHGRPDPLRPVEAHARASRCAQRCISDAGIRWDRPGRRRRAVVGRVRERALPRPAAAALLRRRSAPRAAPRRPAPPAPPTGVALHAGELGEVMTDEQFRGFDKDLDGQARRPARAPRSEGTDALSPRGMNNTRTKPSCEQAPPPAVTQASAARAQLDIDEVQAFVNRFMVGGPLAAQPRPLAAREGALCARSGSRLTRQRL